MKTKLKRLQNNLFATRDTPEKAIQYAYDAITKTIPEESQLLMLTAVHIVINSIIKELDQIEE